MIIRPFYRIHKQRSKPVYLSEYQLDLRLLIDKFLALDTIPSEYPKWGKSAITG